MTESNKTEAARVPTNRDRAFARQFALLGLYEWLVNPLSSPEALALIVPSLINQEDTEAGDLTPEEFDHCDQELFRALLTEAITNREELEAEFSQYLYRPLKQVSTVEHAILLLGTTELRYHPETAYLVILDQMVELAKRFGSAEGGYKFVNGVLDKVARDLRPEETARGRAA